MFKFIHAADIHLDSPMHKLDYYEGAPVEALRQATRRALENLVALATGADLLVCEAAMPDALKVPGHLTPSLAGDLAARAKVKKLVLTHLYPECDQFDIAAQCRRTYPGPLVIAEDLMRMEV